MIILKDATEKLNAGQKPVIAVNQPLLFMCNGQDQKCLVNFMVSVCHRCGVIMLGGLHIKTTLWNLVGDKRKATGVKL